MLHCNRIGWALPLLLACNSGTTVLGEQRATQVTAQGGNASASNPDAATDFQGPDAQHDDHDPDHAHPCFRKHCGSLCGEGPGDGLEGNRFCDQRGDCVLGFPQCNQGERCEEDRDCFELAPFLPITCLQCSDGRIECGSARCNAGSCEMTPPSCTSGVLGCGQDQACPFVNPSGCEDCDVDLRCATPACVFNQCVVLPHRCEATFECLNRQCGDICGGCPPDDPRCDDPPMTCNPFGECVAGENFCPEPQP
jgi:hypothetical protein